MIEFFDVRAIEVSEMPVLLVKLVRCVSYIPGTFLFIADYLEAETIY